MVDQDFYLTPEDFEEFEGHPIAFYTVVPNAVAGRSGQATWYIDRDGVFHESVRGGREYHHALWDWSGENVLIGRVLYDIERIPSPSDSTRCIVVLCPTVSWEALSPYSFRRLAAAAGLRFNQVRRHVGVEVIGPPDAPVVAALVRPPGEPGFYSLRYEAVRDGTCLNVPESQFVSLQKKARDDAKGGVPHLTVYYLQAHAKSIGIPPDDQAARVLLMSAVNCLHSSGSESGAFIPLVSGYDPEPGRRGTTVPCPVAPAVASADLMASLFVSVKGMQQRINRVGADDVRATDLIAVKAAARAIRDLLTSEGPLVPLTAEEVREIQRLPLQRARNDVLFNNGAVTEAKLRVRVNPKGETLNAAKGRKIVLCPTEHTIELSRFMYPVEARVKRLISAWAPGKSPVELARTLREIHARAELCGSDYTAMDDTVSILLRELISDDILVSMFSGSDAAALRALVESEHVVSIYASLGAEKVRFRTSGGNISGSRLTTWLNTIINLVFSLAGCALTKLRSAGLRATSAVWPSMLEVQVYMFAKAFLADGVCLVGGDDGVIPKWASAEVRRLSSAFGMTIKIDTWYDGRVEFYSRVYPDLSRTLASYPCVDRCLGKLALSRPGDAGFGAKWAGVLASDPITPLVADYASALLRVYPRTAIDAMDRDYVRKAAAGAYPVTEEDGDLLIGYMAADLEVAEEDVRQAIGVYRAARTPGDLMGVRFSVAPRAEKLACVWL